MIVSVQCFSSLNCVFLKIAHNDSLEQYLKSSGGKTHEKKLAVQILAKPTKTGLKIRFFANFSCLFCWFSFKLNWMIAWGNV